MSNTDRKTTSDFADLLSALDLKPVRLDPMPFGKFLQELSEHPERADTAHGLLVRAIEAQGEVDIDKEPEERRPYLRMLKEAGIKLFVAFDHVRGSHRFAHKLMQHLRAASANGYQLFLAIIVKGPPGSGKSMFVDAIKATLEGSIVHTMDGCPVHENPLNLLKLLSDKAIDDLAARLGLTEEECEGTSKRSLRSMLAVAGDPCQHCWSAVMESKCEKDPNKALLNMQIIPMRLSARKFGIATWTSNSSLNASLERGSRGMVDMGELFDGSNPLMQVSNPQLKILLDATNDRRIPGGGHAHGPKGAAGKVISAAADALNLPEPVKGAAEAVGAACAPDSEPDGSTYQPLDAVLFGQTNIGAWENFVKSLGKDAGKFTRRFWVTSYDYNTSVTEEEFAYRDRIGLMRDVPHFDPMSLMLLSLMAVISRLKPDHAVDIVERARIYDGERLEIKRTTSTGGKSEFWTAKELWKDAAGSKEGLTGLDMTVMFNMLSEIIDRAMREPRFERCVSSYEMITFLRERLKELEDSDGFTDEQRAVIKRCRETFLAPAKSKGEKPGTIEAEYRRILQRELYEVAAPDFDRRAKALFERYRAHVQALNTRQTHVMETVDSLTGGKPRVEKVAVDTKFLGDLESHMGIYSEKEREEFRAGLETSIFAIIRERRQSGLLDEEKADEITWETIPQIAKGIRKKLNTETRMRLERLLKTDLELQDETEEDRRLRAEMMAKFNERGYCAHCLSQALEYFKLNELWALQS
jgi:predicted Ser/Thr protein kinase